MSDKDSGDKQPWLVPIVLAVISTISAIAVAWINNPQPTPSPYQVSPSVLPTPTPSPIPTLTKQPDSPKISSTPNTPSPRPETPTGLTKNWAGDWICKASDHDMHLTITGRDWSSLPKGYYPVAYGNRPATEEYIIRDISDSSASGEYIYYDENPNVGYQGRPGVWKGDWSLELAGEAMSLTRKDHTSPWQGEYKCTRR
jgi:hypothetical protein